VHVEIVFAFERADARRTTETMALPEVRLHAEPPLLLLPSDPRERERALDAERWGDDVLQRYRDDPPACRRSATCVF
jgi:hypothetical protein